MEYRGYRLPTQAELDAMKNVDVSNVDKSDLVNIEDVVVDGSLPQKERIMDYLRQIRNPYCYLSGGMVVKVSFAGKTRLEDCMARYYKSKMA